MSNAAPRAEFPLKATPKIDFVFGRVAPLVSLNFSHSLSECGGTFCYKHLLEFLIAGPSESTSFIPVSDGQLKRRLANGPSAEGTFLERRSYHMAYGIWAVMSTFTANKKGKNTIFGMLFPIPI